MTIGDSGRSGPIRMKGGVGAASVMGLAQVAPPWDRRNGSPQGVWRCRYASRIKMRGEGAEDDMLRILLAEDDEAMRVYLARALERVGYRVTAVDNGAVA